jgi:hypothetical protein
MASVPPAQALWTFSIYLEALAILPQLIVLQRYREVENLTSNYIFFLGAYRALYILNWVSDGQDQRTMADHMAALVFVWVSICEQSAGWLTKYTPDSATTDLQVIHRKALPPRLDRVCVWRGADSPVHRLLLLLCAQVSLRSHRPDFRFVCPSARPLCLLGGIAVISYASGLFRSCSKWYGGRMSLPTFK